MNPHKLTGIMAIIVGLLTTVSALAIMVNAPSYGDPGAAPSSTEPMASGEVASESFDPVAFMRNVQNSQVESRYVYMPNIFSPYLSDSQVSPLYTRSPAPMGIVDYGYMEPSGFIIPYSYQTAGFMGTVMFENISTMYDLNRNPGDIAVQLSAVLDGVTVHGGDNHSFWVKNIVLYDTSSERIQLISNVWDFSTPSMMLNDDSISSGNGNVLQSSFYYFAGPSLSISGESTISLYLKYFNQNGSDAVQFQYSISNTEGGSTNGTSRAITFDTVVFNSDSASGNAMFEVSGFSKTPAGFLYDVEMVVTGPGEGSTTTVYGANGQMTLKFLSADGVYTKLPATYNYGSNTGETVQGLSVWWSSLMKPMAHLSLGPSLLVSMWGSQVSHSGAVNLQGTIEPANAFVFVSMGPAFDNTTAAWAPVSQNGSYKFSLPGRIDYSGIVMLSNYDPAYFTTSSGETHNESADEGTGQPHGGQGGSGEEETAAWINITLESNVSKGVYTPLYATGNDQIKYLTVGSGTSGNFTGNGTAEAPYIIENNMFSMVPSLFWHTNYFLYPVFSGILMKDTTARVDIVNPPAYYMKYQIDKLFALNLLGLPTSNSLGLLFVNTNGINLMDADHITGWYPDIMPDTIGSGAVFINSTNYLIANNTFNNMGGSLLLYNSYVENTQGTIWGNHFLKDYSLDSPFSQHMKNGADPVAIAVYSSGNLIYNNYFASGLNVKSPSQDLYNQSENSIYTNNWNLSDRMPLNYVNKVNGVNLTGSIVDCGYQGGNYWEREIANIPFDSEGGIAVGGDYHPLMPETFNITFHALGLSKGTQWYLTVDQNRIYASAGSEITFQTMNGTHSFKVGKPSNYTTDVTYSSFTITGESADINITFSHLVYSITISEGGLHANSQWSANIGSEIKWASGNEVTFLRENGSYKYSLNVPAGFYSPVSSSTILVSGSDVQVNVSFSYYLHNLTFLMAGSEIPSAWNVTLDGMTYETTAPSITIQVANGVYSYSVSSPENYLFSPSTGGINVLDDDVVVSVSASEPVHFVVFHQIGAMSGAHWSVDMGGRVLESAGSDIVFVLSPGDYTYSVNVPGGYASSIASGNITVSSQDQTVNLQFSRNPDIIGAALLLGIGSAIGLSGGLAVGIILFKKIK